MQSIKTMIVIVGAMALTGCARPAPDPALTLNVAGCHTTPIDVACPGEPVAVSACADGTFFLFEDGRRVPVSGDGAPPAFKVLGKNDPPRVCPTPR